MLQGWFGSKPLPAVPAGVQLRQPGPCCLLGRLLCLHPAELPVNGAWHWCQCQAEGVWWHCTFVTQFLFGSVTTESFCTCCRAGPTCSSCAYLQVSKGCWCLGKSGCFDHSGGAAPVPAVPGLCQAVSVWGLWGSLSGVLGWNQGLLGAGHGLSEVGAVSSPGLCLLSSFYFSFPSREADSAHQGVLMVAQGRVRHRNLLTHFWGKSPRLQSWSETGKSN